MIEQQGFEVFQRDLDQLMEALASFPQVAAGETGLAIEQALMLLQGDAADYPPQPADSTYRRTGTLGRLWVGARRVVQTGGSGAFVVGRVGNATPYGPYVQSPDEQAQVHQGVWRDTDQIVQDNEAGVAMILEQAGGAIVEQVAGAIG